MIIEQLEMGKVAGPLEWLDIVWALTVLNKQSAEQVSSVLTADFLDNIQTLSSGELTFIWLVTVSYTLSFKFELMMELQHLVIS